MKKLTIALLTSVFVLGNGIALAESGTGTGLDNATAKNGSVASSAKENVEPKNIDNSKINTEGHQNSLSDKKDKQSHDTVKDADNTKATETDSKSH